MEKKKEEYCRGRAEVFQGHLTDFHITECHIDSFDHLIDSGISNILSNNNRICVLSDPYKVILEISDPEIVPQPQNLGECYSSYTSYSCGVTASIKVDVLTSDLTNTRSADPNYPYLKSTTTYPAVQICQLPLMVSSRICQMNSRLLRDCLEPEVGGYFVINGKRRYIPTIKSAVNNVPYFLEDPSKKKRRYVQIRSEHNHRPYRSTSTLELFFTVNKKLPGLGPSTCVVKPPFISQPVKMSLLLVIFDCNCEEFMQSVIRQLGEHWNAQKFSAYSILPHEVYPTKKSALDHLNALYGKTEGSGTATGIIENEILPHLNNQSDNTEHDKVNFLAYLYGLLILFQEGGLPPSDRDSLAHTTLITSGHSLGVLFRSCWLSQMRLCAKSTRYLLKRNAPIDLARIMDSQRLSKKLESALGTGAWSKKRKGVSHGVISSNINCLISQLRKITSSSINSCSKQVAPRMLASGGYGYICASETPEVYPYCMFYFFFDCFLLFRLSLIYFG
jgi:DNA-directed RNA polymerase beta subunit